MASIIVGFTLLVSCIVALLVVSRLGRKIMLVASMMAMGICHTVLGICFHVQQNEMPVPQGNSLIGKLVFLEFHQYFKLVTSSPLDQSNSSFSINRFL